MNLIKILPRPALFWLCFFVFAELELCFITWADRPIATFMNENKASLQSGYTLSLFGLGIWYLVPTGICALLSGLFLKAPFAFLQSWKNKTGLNNPEKQQKIVIFFKKTAFFFAAVASAGIINNIIKYFVGRGRPNIYLQEHLFNLQPLTYAHHWNSWPSGHATNIFAVATALAFLFPRLKILFYIIGIAVCLARVMVNAHYLSDVLAGGLLGWLIVTLWQKHLTNNGFFPQTPRK